MGLRLFTDNFTAPFQLHLAICSHMHKQWIPGHSFGGGGGGGGGGLGTRLPHPQATPTPKRALFRGCGLRIRAWGGGGGGEPGNEARHDWLLCGHD